MKIINALDVLINCEESGVVREAFSALGHNAWSCDLEPSRSPGNHLQMDAREAALLRPWDLMIAHPPCTFLSNSGAKHLYINMKKINGRYEPRWKKLREAGLFFRELLEAPVPYIALENPIMLPYGVEIIGRNWDQKIQPWQFGHGETKATCLWLKNLPRLKPTDIVNGREPRILRMGPSETRRRDRSVTYPGIAQAMADQWSQYILNQKKENQS